MSETVFRQQNRKWNDENDLLLCCISQYQKSFLLVSPTASYQSTQTEQLKPAMYLVSCLEIGVLKLPIHQARLKALLRVYLLKNIRKPTSVLPMAILLMKLA